jgi:hypothetical protein
MVPLLNQAELELGLPSQSNLRQYLKTGDKKKEKETG